MIAVAVWYFIAVVASTDQSVMLGPYDTKEICEEIRRYVMTEYVVSVGPCVRIHTMKAHQ
ncbi:hypothetical protein [Nitrospira sp. BLG_1]|uniref:hypothetical protein n=1 Tax=Nitrospira sp. BLG_1 TaxID=3395883 RepID=UPI0039BD0366